MAWKKDPANVRARLGSNVNCSLAACPLRWVGRVPLIGSGNAVTFGVKLLKAERRGSLRSATGPPQSCRDTLETQPRARCSLQQHLFRTSSCTRMQKQMGATLRAEQATHRPAKWPCQHIQSTKTHFIHKTSAAFATCSKSQRHDGGKNKWRPSHNSTPEGKINGGLLKGENVELYKA